MTDLWVEVHGLTGSGKSTLLRVIKDALTPRRKLPEVLQGKPIPLYEVREMKTLVKKRSKNAA